MADTKIVWNENAFGWNGVVGTWLDRKLHELEVGAKASVGVETGELQQKIEVKKHPKIRENLSGSVGANPDEDLEGYAAMHHNGTKPHIITPKNPNGLLKFRSKGKLVYAKKVHHPGTKPNNYLTRWLRILFS